MDVKNHGDPKIEPGVKIHPFETQKSPRKFIYILLGIFFTLLISIILLLFFVTKEKIPQERQQEDKSSPELIYKTSTPTTSYILSPTPNMENSQDNIKLDLYPKDYAILKNPEKWQKQLDETYNLFKDLTGHVPFNGSTITIKEVNEKEMNNAGMLSGNPIKWNDNYVANDLKSINEHNDLSFGPIHELGHNFDIYFSSTDYLKGNYNLLSVEHWANFKAIYVIDALAKSYPSSQVYQPSAGYFPAEKFSHDYFYGIAKKWRDSGNNDWTKMSNDAYTGFLFSLTEKYGWEPFKKLFREYNSDEFLNNLPPKDDIGKIQLFADTLSKYVGSSVKKDFQDWGLPVN